MKKLALTCIMLLVLSISIFADGTIHTGGRTCPQGQTTCFANSETVDNPSYTKIEEIFAFLKSLFG